MEILQDIFSGLILGVFFLLLGLVNGKIIQKDNLTGKIVFIALNYVFLIIGGIIMGWEPFYALASIFVAFFAIIQIRYKILEDIYQIMINLLPRPERKMSIEDQ